ncbi:SDR family oxidoreductase [Trichothermofontia sichuanensis B231]|uniref:SDR family oxidoreductase n=1 Tax=Trichothermofontia sichuanensis TaxID=3045816 RepID=UPI002247F15C|nr:SDR family oxidoreductase [Trichothermofontia sichuanensis]UZQ53369.1 SDR family oxidoreductase [Trichothermofontia sichuanensis B231]
MYDKTVLIIGATSSIAKAIAVQLAQQGKALHLAGRDAEEVERTAQDLAIRYQAPVSWSQFEATAYHTHVDFFEKAIAQMGQLEGVIVSLGELGDQVQAQADFSQAQRIIESNYTGVVSILTPVANYLEQQRQGYIIGISSVAGDRGRQSNYIYGSAKGALSLFLQGLRSRLAKVGVQVLTVKPGFVDTKMTFGKSGMFLVAQPEQVAKAILRARDRRKNIVYVPWFWFWIMVIIRSIPEPLFKKLKL